MKILLLGAIGFVLGLYAGKGRARCKTWRRIAYESWYEVYSVVIKSMMWVSDQFKKDVSCVDAPSKGAEDVRR